MQARDLRWPACQLTCTHACTPACMPDCLCVPKVSAGAVSKVVRVRAVLDTPPCPSGTHTRFTHDGGALAASAGTRQEGCIYLRFPVLAYLAGGGCGSGGLEDWRVCAAAPDVAMTQSLGCELTMRVDVRRCGADKLAQGGGSDPAGGGRAGGGGGSEEDNGDGIAIAKRLTLARVTRHDSSGVSSYSRPLRAFFQGAASSGVPKASHGIADAAGNTSRGPRGDTAGDTGIDATGHTRQDAPGPENAPRVERLTAAAIATETAGGTGRDRQRQAHVIVAEGDIFGVWVRDSHLRGAAALQSDSDSDEEILDSTLAHTHAHTHAHTRTLVEGTEAIQYSTDDMYLCMHACSVANVLLMCC